MIDPAAKADVDRRMAALHPSGQSYQAPTAFFPVPPAVGQWAQYRMIENGAPSFFTYQIVGAQAGAFWLQGVIDRYSGRQIVRTLITMPPDGSTNAVQMSSTSVTGGGGALQVDPALLALLQSRAGWKGKSQESANVPAGGFADCFKLQINAAAGPSRTSIMTWSHPGVPLSGLVRSQGLDGVPSTMELVAFGFSGTPGTP
jgi:hypothetical protein